MILEEIISRKNKDSKRKVIQDNLGRQVILNDSHQKWVHGTLLRDGYNREFYQMKIAGEKGQTQFYYNDLKQLLVIRLYRKHKSFKFN